MSFEVLPTGEIQSTRIERSSGHSVLDNAAKLAVELSSPCPPFSQELKERTDIVGIIKTFSYEKNTSYTLAKTSAGSGSEDRTKAKIVSRLYQATYGARERCKKATPIAAAEFENDLTRFVGEKANLIKLVTQSPHYDSARQNFATHIVIDPAKETSEMLAGECNYLALMLRAMIDTPEGQKSAKEFETLLSK